MPHRKDNSMVSTLGEPKNFKGFNLGNPKRVFGPLLANPCLIKNLKLNNDPFSEKRRNRVKPGFGEDEQYVEWRNSSPLKKRVLGYYQKKLMRLLYSPGGTKRDKLKNNFR